MLKYRHVRICWESVVVGVGVDVGETGDDVDARELGSCRE